MTHVRLRIKATFSFEVVFMHPWPGNWVAIGRSVVYYDRDAHAFSADIKCRHCIFLNLLMTWFQ